MKVIQKVPPRIFEVGLDNKIKLSDCGKITLKPDEMITFTTESGKEYDVVRKNWGFYATPSLNGRLKKFDLRAVLVKNQKNHFFIFLIEKGKENLFTNYMQVEKQKIVCWMDNTDAIKKLERKIKS